MCSCKRKSAFLTLMGKKFNFALYNLGVGILNDIKVNMAKVLFVVYITIS